MTWDGTELLVEIQCEELPARFVGPATESLRAGVVGLLEGIGHGAVHAYGTPRRLAVVVEAVAAERPKVTRLVTGPPADRAFVDGKPTPAAVGFAKGKGVDPSGILVVDGPKGKVIAVEVSEGGQRTADRLSEGLPGVITGIPFAKSMEWGHGGRRWGRPFHRVSALLHGAVVPGEAGGVAFGNETVGHRLAADTVFRFDSASAWLTGLRARAVEPDASVRREAIRAMLADANDRFGGDGRVDEELLAEVTNLVEAPTLVIGEFAAELLGLPSKLLVQSMKHHQRYFPIFVDGALTHRFVTISNNPWGDPSLVARGNARVLAARFDDARFFFAEDKGHPLSANVAQLGRMRWIRGLGTMAQKQERIAALGAALAPLVGADPAVAARAGALAKCDLVSKMVGEFPELQGHMGRLYAAAQGEPEAVAVAIEEHYAPKGASDDVAQTPAGQALALADRLDTLVGCFGVGMVPSSGGDPQGLRRAVAGVLSTLTTHGHRVELRALFGTAIASFHAAVVASPAGFEEWAKRRGLGEAALDADALAGELTEFALGRLKAAEVGEGTTADLVDAVLAVGAPDPVALRARLSALRGVAGNPDFGRIMVTFKRVLNITRGQDFPAPSADTLGHPAERALSAAVARVEGQVAGAAERLAFDEALAHALTLQEPVAALFDAVMVDSPDPAEKAARMGLLLQVARTFLLVADFSRISTR